MTSATTRTEERKLWDLLVFVLDSIRCTPDKESKRRYAKEFSKALNEWLEKQT